jgi:hypothetical protein
LLTGGTLHLLFPSPCPGAWSRKDGVNCTMIQEEEEEEKKKKRKKRKRKKKRGKNKRQPDLQNVDLPLCSNPSPLRHELYVS